MAVSNQKKSQGMSRDEAMNMYRGLQDSVINILKKDTDPVSSPVTSNEQKTVHRAVPAHDQWLQSMLLLIGVLAVTRGALSVLGLAGILDVQPAQAAVRELSTAEIIGIKGKTEQELFTSLDQRRADLEQRRTQLDDREVDLKEQEDELAIQLTELRQLTHELRAARSAQGTKKEAQIEQLSKVYVSMKPEEAAKLLQELDIVIAFELIKKMPEKRIGQLLAMMNAEKSVLITRMLTGTAASVEATH
jgi:flagellar motility protein MotE (MotC chaperone)